MDRFGVNSTAADGLAALFYLIFVGSVLAYTAFNYMIKTLHMAKAGTYAYVNPVVAVILGYLILNEVVTAQTIVAALIILGGVVLVQISKVKLL